MEKLFCLCNLVCGAGCTSVSKQAHITGPIGPGSAPSMHALMQSSATGWFPTRANKNEMLFVKNGKDCAFDFKQMESHAGSSGLCPVVVIATATATAAAAAVAVAVVCMMLQLSLKLSMFCDLL